MGKVVSKNKTESTDNECITEIDKDLKKSNKKKPKKKSSLITRKKSRKDSSSSFSKRKLDELFEIYKNVKEEEEVEENIIGTNGVSKLLSDIGLSADDVLSFVIGWRFECQEIGYLSREEFIEGLTKLKIDSIEKLKESIPQLQLDFNENKDKIWQWTFLASQERKVLELEAAYILIGLFFPVEDNIPHTTEFIEFLKEQDEAKNLTKDQWNTYYEFIHSVNEDLSDYDPEDSWPVIIDEYINWKMKRNTIPEGAGTHSRVSYGLENKPVLGWGSDMGKVDYSGWY